MPDEVLKSHKLQRDHSGDERRKAKPAREQRDDADLQEKSAKTDEVEDTPPSEIDPHVCQCVERRASGSSGAARTLLPGITGGKGAAARAWVVDFRDGLRQRQARTRVLRRRLRPATAIRHGSCRHDQRKPMETPVELPRCLSAPERIFPTQRCPTKRTRSRFQQSHDRSRAVCSNGRRYAGFSRLISASAKRFSVCEVTDSSAGIRSPIRSNHEGPPESLRVSDLSSEVQAAHMSEELADGHSFGSKTLRDGERRPGRRAPAALAGLGSWLEIAEKPGFSLARFYQRVSPTVRRHTQMAPGRRQHDNANQKQHECRKRKIARCRDAAAVA